MDNTICEMLRFASLSYGDVQPCENGAKTISIDDSLSGIQLVARLYEHRVVIAFRGSDSLKDAVTDIKFYRKKIPYNKSTSRIRVHAGFINSYKTKHLRKEILNLITPEITDIRLTGHSYGAALSVLCASDLQEKFPDKDFEVYLFGCPRVGNRHFLKSYKSRILKTFRIENGNDIVTKLPPAILGYRHVGHKVHTGKKRIPFIYSLKDHSIENYFTVTLCPSDNNRAEIRI